MTHENDKQKFVYKTKTTKCFVNSHEQLIGRKYLFFTKKEQVT